MTRVSARSTSSMYLAGLHRHYYALLVGAWLLLGGFASSQDSKPATDNNAAPSVSQVATPPAQDAQGSDPLKRPISEKQKKENAKSLKVELSKTYKKWLDEDVVYIISDEERKAFKQLSNDEERDQFIEAFWQRRDPTPDTEENEFKEEH